MSLLEVQNLSVRFGSAVIVDGVSFSVKPGDWLMLIGPNGAGKSTIVNAVSRGVPYTGTVLFEGKDVQKMPAHLLARGMGVLAQQHTVGYAFSVEEVVRLGRYAYAPGIFSRRSSEDERSVAEAMDLTGVAHLARQSVLTLSGGELQRVFLAQLFAQRSRRGVGRARSLARADVRKPRRAARPRQNRRRGGWRGRVRAGNAKRRLPHGRRRLDAYHALPMGQVKKAGG